MPEESIMPPALAAKQYIKQNNLRYVKVEYKRKVYKYY